MRNPRFNSSVIEALCLKLKLQGYELSDKFYRIFTSGEKELEYYRKQEVDDVLWQACQSQFDYTAEDIEFWKKVFDLKGLTLDQDALKKDKASYIAAEMGINLDRCVSVNKFRAYHMQKLRESRENYKLRYLHYVYGELVGTPERHKEYHIRHIEYNDDRWLEELLGDNKYSVELEYDALVHKAIYERFNCNVSDYEPVEHKLLKCYKEIDTYCLSDEDRGLLYFEGYLEHLKRSAQDDDQQQETEVASETIPRICSIQESNISRTKPNPSSSEVSLRSHISKGRGKVSENRKRQLGNQAENAVFAALQASEDYKILHVYSSNLAENDLGDDSKGYDLEYIKVGETLSRFLEIKHTDGKSIILTANEYDVAMSAECRDRYDLALYHDGKVTIVRTPFIDNQKFDIQANDYTVRFKID